MVNFYTKNLFFLFFYFFNKRVLVFCKKSNNEFFFFLQKNFNFFIFFLKNHTFVRADMLLHMTALDLKKNNFFLGYSFLSLFFNFIFLIFKKIFFFKEKFFFFETNTVNFLYKSASWIEREIWDMFGVFFRFNGDLRRILTDYNFFYFPLRKNYEI